MSSRDPPNFMNSCWNLVLNLRKGTDQINAQAEIDVIRTQGLIPTQHML